MLGMPGDGATLGETPVDEGGTIGATAPGPAPGSAGPPDTGAARVIGMSGVVPG